MKSRDVAVTRHLDEHGVKHFRKLDDGTLSWRDGGREDGLELRKELLVDGVYAYEIAKDCVDLGERQHGYGSAAAAASVCSRLALA